MAAGAWTGDVTIYALCDPDSLAVRYVGKANDMRARIRSHRHEAKSQKFRTRKANWLRSLGGRDPVVMILAIVK
jgi:predicted GIY-YIG superfamily endonuclease